MLAALGGAIGTPVRVAAPGIGAAMIIQAFIITVIGGLGNLKGAFVSSLIVGVLSAYGTLFFPVFELFFIFVIMAVVLLVRPAGTCSRAESRSMSGRLSPRICVLLALLVLGSCVLPWVAGRYPIYLVMQILILAVFSLGLQSAVRLHGAALVRPGRIFRGGRLRVREDPAGRPQSLARNRGRRRACGCRGASSGTLSVRHTRIYFSMLTLAFGMMIYSIAWKWRDFTGGDDGLVGIPRAPLEIPGLLEHQRVGHRALLLRRLRARRFSRSSAMYRLVRSPLGLALQAIRDSETRAEFAGIPVRKYRLVAFTIAGLYAGLAGALLPPLENTVTPPIAHWSTSAEPVLATLLGGIHSFAGPIVGSVLFFVIKDVIVRFTEYWLIWFGVIVVALVMGFPEGVMSLFSRRRRRAAQPASAADPPST